MVRSIVPAVNTMASYWYWNLLYLLCAMYAGCWVPTRAGECVVERLNCSLENVNTTHLIATLPVLPKFPCSNCTASLDCCAEEPTTTVVSTTTTDISTTTTDISTTTTDISTTTSTTETPSTSTSTSASTTPGNLTTPSSTDGQTIASSTTENATTTRKGPPPSPPVTPTPSPPGSNDTLRIVIIVVVVLVCVAFLICLIIVLLKYFHWRPNRVHLGKNEIPIEQVTSAAAELAGNGKIKVEKHLRPGSIELVPVVVAQNTSTCNASAPCKPP